HLGRIGGREGERAALQPPEVEGEAVPLPGQDLQPVAAAIAEHVQVTAEGVPAEVVADHGLQAVEALATVLRLGTDPDPPGQAEGGHGCPPRAAIRRATAAGSAPSGTRTSKPLGRITSAVRSGRTRTGANVGAGGPGSGSRVASRRRQV